MSADKGASCTPLRGERGPTAPGISHPVKQRAGAWQRRRAPRVISCCVDGDHAAPEPCPWHGVVCGEWRRRAPVRVDSVLMTVAAVLMVAIFVWTLAGGGRLW